jgi:hypothetical protein
MWTSENFALRIRLLRDGPVTVYVDRESGRGSLRYVQGTGVRGAHPSPVPPQ